MTPSEDRRERPNRIPWPPIIVFAAAGCAFMLGRLSPLAICLSGLPYQRPAGFLLMIAALALDGAAMLEMRRRRANILPHRAATTLVTTGPFAWSRNPIYLGNVSLLTGAAFAFGNFWDLAAAVCTGAATEVLAVRREEKHLAALFGDEWRAYRDRTPRWIGIRSGTRR